MTFKKTPFFSILINSLFFTIPLFGSASEGVFDDSKEMLRSAERLMRGGCYDEACIAYRSILSTFPPHSSENLEGISVSQIEYQLAYCLFLSKNHQKAHEILSILLKRNDHTIQPLAYILDARTKEALEDFPSALDSLNAYFKSTPSNSPQRNDALLLHAQLSYALSNTRQARESLKPILSSSSHSFPSRVLLSKIEKEEGHLDIACAHLKKLQSELPKDNPLKYEVAFLLGEIAFDSHLYEEASISYQLALPSKKKENPLWISHTLSRLATCYWLLANEQLEKKEYFLKKAEEMHLSLYSHDPSIEHLLSLGEFYIETGSNKKAYALLSKEKHHHNQNARCKILFLQARAAPTYKERNTLYKELAKEENETDAFYLEGLYAKALNHYNEGLTLLEKEQSANSLFLQAANDAAYLFSLTKKDEPSLAARALLLEVQAHEKLNDHLSLQKAKNLLAKLKKDPSLLQTLDDPSSIFLIEGNLLAALSKETENPKTKKAAIDSWTMCIENTPSSPSAPQALYSLATFHFEEKQLELAEKYYLQLINTYPGSPLAGQALFFTSQSAKLKGKPKKEVQALLRRSFEEYPNSPYAAEAFFSYESYNEYLNPHSSANQHLKQMTKLYPKSPWTLYALYLLGMQEKENQETPLREQHLRRAVSLFQEAEKSFLSLWDTRSLPKTQKDSLISLYYQAALERGGSYLELAKLSTGAKRKVYLEYAADRFEELQNEADQHLYQSIATLYPTLYEETSLGLITSLMEQKAWDLANTALEKMIRKSKHATITRSYFLARAWTLKGLIAYAHQNYSSALEYFQQAEEASRGKLLSADQWLDLLIHKSHCHLALGKDRLAMRILSDVVNAKVVSQRRLEAMYLRADIYALQGRSELAKRQLEALANKAGPWAQKAQTTLDQKYGY